VDLREVAVGREDQDALRGLAERMRLGAVRGGDLGDDERPGADELVAQARALLRGGLAEHQCKRERGGDDLHEFHDVLPMSCSSP
jgi:hypothetical protein